MVVVRSATGFLLGSGCAVPVSSKTCWRAPAITSDVGARSPSCRREGLVGRRQVVQGPLTVALVGRAVHQRQGRRPEVAEGPQRGTGVRRETRGVEHLLRRQRPTQRVVGGEGRPLPDGGE